jgi:hypothetical protein
MKNNFNIKIINKKIKNLKKFYNNKIQRILTNKKYNPKVISLHYI